MTHRPYPIARLLLVTVLGLLAGGCSDPAPAISDSKTPSADKNTVIAASAGDHIPATVVPTTNGKRQAMLDNLKLTKQSPLADQRLALFLRYTLLTGRQPRLAPLEQLISEISEMVGQHKNDYELLALLGSATRLQTIFYLDNLGKTNLLAKKGSRYLDRAVKKAPKHLGVRLYRGITYAEMPGFLGKARQAVDDFSLLKTAMGFKTEGEFSAMVDYYFAMALIKDQQQASGLKQLGLLAKRNIAPWSQRAAVLIKEKGE
jgi:hypothetical protein